MLHLSLMLMNSFHEIVLAVLKLYRPSPFLKDPFLQIIWSGIVRFTTKKTYFHVIKRLRLWISPIHFTCE